MVISIMTSLGNLFTIACELISVQTLVLHFSELKAEALSATYLPFLFPREMGQMVHTFPCNIELNPVRWNHVFYQLHRAES